MTVEQPLGEFLDDLASAKPTPGGGGAAGIGGAMSAALTSMVCNLTIGKKKYEEVAVEMKEILKESETLRRRFQELVNEDAEAFRSLLETFRLPKETDDEKASRRAAIEAATKKAAEVPFETMQRCCQILPLAQAAADKGNINAVSDAGVAALMAGAAAQAAALNVQINLAILRDREWAQEKFREMSRMLAEVRVGADQILKVVTKKISG